MITGWRCAVCQATLPIATPWPWRCPSATPDDRHHVLYRTGQPALVSPASVEPNPIVAFDGLMAWAAFAAANGMNADERARLVRAVDAAIAAVAGTGFRVTPLARSARMSEALGFGADGGVWVKDETGNVTGSHKGRHLIGILLHLLAAERLGVAPQPRRPKLAIASCGNAALAAAALARAVDWPLLVFVPTWANAAVLDRLGAFGAEITVCPRAASDPPGDPCLHRFREAVKEGAIPFAVQGPENALALDAGRTLGWEVFRALPRVDRVFVQVGGGALATCTALAAHDLGVSPRLHPVQAEGCAPLARAWARATHIGLEVAPTQWGSCMWPWEDEPRSAAEGILDDETYDWLGVVQGMAASGGSPVVATEAQIAEARDLGRRLTGSGVSATGTAGLAGLLALRGDVDDDERVVVLFTGHER